MNSRTSLARSSAPARAGFTLIELLVVVGIIIVLISLLLPTLSRARVMSASATCLNNLRQLGQANLVYANEHGGDMLPARHDSIEWLPPASLRWVNAHFNNPSTDSSKTRYAEAITIFFCPSNNIRPWVPGGFADGTEAGRMRYWWLANPRNASEVATLMPPAFDDSWAARTWIDASPKGNPDGSTRDEYVRNLKDRNLPQIAIATDQSRQFSTTTDWYMIHGTGGDSPKNDPDKRKKNSWKNNLYGDGHVESVRPDAVIHRWGANSPAGW
jgi:prepilin-type N-terminal cleavage/methylation domain-containing protein